jgi:fatty-acyl-CoA synthase
MGGVLGNIAALTHGSAVVLPSETFVPQACLAAVEREGCTALYGVPTMFLAQLRHPEFSRYRLDSLRTGLSGGASCPVPLMHEIVERMNLSGLQISYGMTETPPVLQTWPRDSIADRAATVGTPLPHVECKVIDAEGRTLPRGLPGELCARSYGVMLGYWNDPQATALAIDSEGWMHTGDLAEMREDGYVVIVGRLKDMILRGGENVYPREIEDVLLAHPAVHSAHVVGVPDADYGEDICAWIQVHQGSTATAPEIRRFCRRHLTLSKTPRFIRFTDVWPMTASGKVQRSRLRQMAIDDLLLTQMAAAPAVGREDH